MNRRKLIAALAALCALGPIVAPVQAGGWATIELTEPVEDVVVGDVVALNIIVLQHGHNPADYTQVVVTASHAETGETSQVDAKATGEPGSYVAEVTFDQPGRWKLRADIPQYAIGSAFPTVYVHEVGDEISPDPIVKSSVDADVVEVNIIGGTFTPSLATVSLGSTVRFTNADAIKHEVAFADSAIDDSGILEPGESFEVTFESPGSFVFVCGPHPGMSGTIEVKA